MTHSIIESDLHDYQNFVYLVANSFFFLIYLLLYGVFVAALVVARAWALGCMDFNSCSTQHSILRSCGTWV